MAMNDVAQQKPLGQVNEVLTQLLALARLSGNFRL